MDKSKYPRVNKNRGTIEISPKIELGKKVGYIQIWMMNETNIVFIPDNQIDALIEGIQFYQKNKHKLA